LPRPSLEKKRRHRGGAFGKRLVGKLGVYEFGSEVAYGIGPVWKRTVCIVQMLCSPRVLRLFEERLLVVAWSAVFRRGPGVVDNSRKTGDWTRGASAYQIHQRTVITVYSDHL
jgi:hypothetical protein